MKKFIFSIAIFMSMGVMITIIGCNKNDSASSIVSSETELVSAKVGTSPTIDGDIDMAWNACQPLKGMAAVPGISDFTFFTGESYNFSIRSMYDAQNIYFLLEYDDPKDSKDRQSWYYDGLQKKWMQHNKFPTSLADKFYEDKFAFLWPTATATSDWNTNTCYSSCHSVNKALGYSTATKHYASTGEIIDMWHWKKVRTGVNNQVDDQKIVPIVDVNMPTTTEKADGGRGSDAKTSGGYSDNVQEIAITGTTTLVKVPKYVIPNKTDYFVINQSEIDNGTAKLVTEVDAVGVLTYSGGTINPVGDLTYQAGTGSKRFPSIINAGPIVGSRGDITSFAKHNGRGWVVEIKRSLATSDLANDVQYDITKSYMFGFAIFENAAIAHGIKTNLKLKFSN